jgi:hypothetical protein
MQKHVEESKKEKQVSPLFRLQVTLHQIVAVSSANAFQHDPPMLRKPHLYIPGTSSQILTLEKKPNISSTKKRDIYINDQNRS